MMGLIDEILHFLSNKFKEFTKINNFEIAYLEAEKIIGSKNIEKLLILFEKEFPSTALYKNKKNVKEFIEGYDQGFLNKSIIIEEILHL